MPRVTVYIFDAWTDAQLAWLRSIGNPMRFSTQAPAREFSEKVTVLFAEPHPLAYRYLVTILGASKTIHLAASCDSIDDKPAHEGSALVLLADKNWTRKPLTAYMQYLESFFPKAKILFLGDSSPMQEICQILLLGATGYVPYDQVESRLRLAIEAVAGGRIWVNPRVLEEFVRYTQQREHNCYPGCGNNLLTSREESVLALLSGRLSNKEIAYELKITERTVRFHLSNIFSKLGVSDRFSAMEAATETDVPGQNHRGAGAGLILHTQNN